MIKILNAYSRKCNIIRFSSRGMFFVHCVKFQTMNDNDEAVVIKPESNRVTGMVKTLHDNELWPQSPPCCGSTTSNAKVSKEKTGKFERKSSGGSFKVTGGS